MKNLYILVTILLPLLSVAQNESKNMVGVTANYHNRSCVGGTGFCSDSSNITESNQANATLQKTAYNQVVMAFDLHSLSNVEIEELYSEKLFTVSGDKNMVLSRNLLTELKIDTRFSEITTGSYPIQIENDKVMVTFVLSKNK